jgi:hypothetical protein
MIDGCRRRSRLIGVVCIHAYYPIAARNFYRGVQIIAEKAICDSTRLTNVPGRETFHEVEVADKDDPLNNQSFFETEPFGTRQRCRKRILEVSETRVRRWAKLAEIRASATIDATTG